MTAEPVVSPSLTYYLVDSEEQRDEMLGAAERYAADFEVYEPERTWAYAILMAGTADEEAAALTEINGTRARWAATGASGIEILDVRIGKTGMLTDTSLENSSLTYFIVGSDEQRERLLGSFDEAADPLSTRLTHIIVVSTLAEEETALQLIAEGRKRMAVAGGDPPIVVDLR
jgi:hypothetical protein